MNKLFYILPVFIVLALSSCQKVIDVDLNSAEPRIVIEADLANNSVCRVTLTRTVNFDELNNFPPVKGAMIRLTDDAGNTEILTENSFYPGFYTTITMNGQPGHTYTLDVTVDGKTYTATEKMADTVAIDSINMQRGFFRNVNNLHVYFTDQHAIDNWYRIVHYVNNELINSIDITDDIARDGQQFDAMIFGGSDEDSLMANDSVYIMLQNIDKGSFKYFNTLFQAEGGGDPGATPANPVSNFSNGALGYFSVYAETRRWFIVKP